VIGDFREGRLVMVPLLELPQGGEWIVILVVVVLLFGANKLPELSRNAARALVEFRKATAGDDEKPRAGARDEQPPVEAASADPRGRGPQSVGEQRGGL
jgi:sec-independent protein translocase protein TatA